MTRPGERLRRLASRLCSPHTMARIVDPVVGDLQVEHAEATGRRALWTARLIRVRACGALAAALALHAIAGADARRRSAIAVGTTGFIVGIALYVGPIVVSVHGKSNASAALLALYLSPGAIPAALSLAMLCWVAHGVGPSAGDLRAIRRAMTFSLLPGLISFTVAAWLLPAANQAFRIAAAGHFVVRGLNELSLGELHALLERTTEPMFLMAPRSLRVVHATYHTRWMLACLPVLAALFGAALAPRRPIVRALGAVGFALGFNAYYVGFLHQRDGGALVSGTLPVWLLVWAPFLLLALASATTLARTAYHGVAGEGDQ